MKMSWKDRLLPGRRRPMSCDEVGRWLQHHLDGELDERRSASLVAHLDDCRRCGLEAETYERIKDALAARQDPVPPASLDRLRDFGARLARGEEPEAPEE
jgi:anti-sigma factor RsiW